MHRTHAIWLLIALITAVAIFALIPLPFLYLSYYVERAAFALHPSAQRAYTFGMRHFDSNNGRAYDLTIASYFLQEAIARDSSLPLAHLQLARVRFIQSHFSDAIALASQEVALSGDTNPTSFYVRGLAEGFSGRYDQAIDDYAHYLQLRPDMWAAYNDEAWVLMKAERFPDARSVLEAGLKMSPDSAWLLNSYAIALYETGDTSGALATAVRAQAAVEKLTPTDWSKAYPGNDPRIAAPGLETFRQAALSNLQRIMDSAATSSVEVR